MAGMMAIQSKTKKYTINLRCVRHLLAVVAALHHDGVGKTLNDGALRLAKALLLPPAGGVGEEGHGLVVELENKVQSCEQIYKGTMQRRHAADDAFPRAEVDAL